MRKRGGRGPRQEVKDESVELEHKRGELESTDQPVGVRVVHVLEGARGQTEPSGGGKKINVNICHS